MIHELKATPKYFESVRKLDKPFEIRRDDRPYKEGDFLALNEYDGDYTGRSMLVQVTYVLDDPQYCKDGFVTMGITPCQIVAQGESVMRFSAFSYASVPVYGKREVVPDEQKE